MKIIEGQFAGTVVDYKENKGTRVTSEKVRKAVFDILKNIIDLENIKVADIFCGSGMYGLEALSRGAGEVFFVDSDRGIISRLKDSIKKMEIKNVFFENKRFESFVEQNRSFDLIFADPPYYDFDFTKINKVFNIMNENGVLVLESSKRIMIGDLENLTLISEKKYGDTKVYFYIKK